MLSKFYSFTANIDSFLNLPHWFVWNKNSTDKNFVSKSIFPPTYLFVPSSPSSLSHSSFQTSQEQSSISYEEYLQLPHYGNWRLLIPADFKITLFEIWLLGSYFIICFIYFRDKILIITWKTHTSIALLLQHLFKSIFLVNQNTIVCWQRV